MHRQKGRDGKGEKVRRIVGQVGGKIREVVGNRLTSVYLWHGSQDLDVYSF